MLLEVILKAFEAYWRSLGHIGKRRRKMPLRTQPGEFHQWRWIVTALWTHTKSIVFARPHAMKRQKIKLPILRNGELKFWATVNFEVEYILNEETEGVLTDTVIYFYGQHLTWLSQLKPNVKVGQSL